MGDDYLRLLEFGGSWFKLSLEEVWIDETHVGMSPENYTCFKRRSVSDVRYFTDFTVDFRISGNGDACVSDFFDSNERISMYIERNIEILFRCGFTPGYHLSHQLLMNVGAECYQNLLGQMLGMYSEISCRFD